MWKKLSVDGLNKLISYWENQPIAVIYVLFYFGVQVSLFIRRDLIERAKDFNIILDDVAITELSFSKEYTAAVEAKQVG